MLELEHERIFERTWQFAAHVSQLPEPGSYLTPNAGTQPVLVRARQRRRAARVPQRLPAPRLAPAERLGRVRKAIRCRYHGWTYRLDGELIGVPEGRSIPSLDKSTLGLFPARVEVMCGLVFVNLDIHATPLAEQVGACPSASRRYGIERLEPIGVDRTASQPANWKIVVDNYLEGYHVPIAHPGLMRLLDYKRYDGRGARD